MKYVYCISEVVNTKIRTSSNKKNKFCGPFTSSLHFIGIDYWSTVFCRIKTYKAGCLVTETGGELKIT